MDSQFIKTAIEFVSAGGNTSNVQTGDWNFWLVLIVCLLFIVSTLIYLTFVSKKEKKLFSVAHNIKCAAVNKNFIIYASIVLSTLIISAVTFVAFGSAMAVDNSENDYAKIDDKITAVVDTETNQVTLSSASFTNLQDNLSAGFDYLSTESNVELENSNIKIWADEQLVYDNIIGSEQYLDDYVAAQIQQSIGLTFELGMDASQASKLIGTSPITITTKADALNTVSGVLYDKDGNPAQNTMIQCSFVVEQPTPHTITRLVYTDEEGKYTLENLKMGAECSLMYGDESQPQLCYKFIVDENSNIPDMKLPIGYVQAPLPELNLVYDGTEKTGVLPVEHVSLLNNKAINAGSYTAEATLLDNYVWSDTKENAGRYINWTIEKGINEIFDLTCSDVNLGEEPSPTCTPKWGSVSDVVYTYAEEGSEDFKEWDLDNPVGAYVVKAYLAGNDNYEEVSDTQIFNVKENTETVLWEDEDGVAVNWSALQITDDYKTQFANLKIGDKLNFDILPNSSGDYAQLKFVSAPSWNWSPDDPEFVHNFDPSSPRFIYTYTVTQKFLDVLASGIFSTDEFGITGANYTVYKATLETV